MNHPGTNQHLLAYDSGAGRVAMYEVESDGALVLKKVAMFSAGFDQLAFMDYLSDWSSYVLFYDKESGNTQVALVDYLDDEVLVREDVQLSPGISSMTPFLRGFISFTDHVPTYPSAVCGGAPAIEETLDTFPVAQSYLQKYNDDFDLAESEWNEGFGYNTFTNKPWRPYARTIRGIYALDKLSDVGIARSGHNDVLNKYEWVLEWLEELDPGCSGPVASAGGPFILFPGAWDGEETITVFHDFFYEMYPIERAAVLVHEAAHTHGGPGHSDCALGDNACDDNYGGNDPGALTYHVDYVAALYNLRNHNSPSSELELTTLMYRRLKAHHASIAIRFKGTQPPALSTALDTTWE